MASNDNNTSSSTISKDDDVNSIEIDNEGEENQAKPMGLVEEVYQDKLADIQKLLSQLEDGTHTEYVKKLKELEDIQNHQLMMNKFERDRTLEAIERDMARECCLIKKEFEERCVELETTLIDNLNEKKRAILKSYIDTTLDSIDPKPAVTRKLRRRPNDPVIPVPQERRRKPLPGSNINYLLNEYEIEQDLKIIQQSLDSIPSTSTSVKTRDTINSASFKKQSIPPISNSSVIMNAKKSQNSDSEESLTAVLGTKIEDGKLLFEKRWYHRGQPIYVEGKSMETFSALISAIGSENIWVKKTVDNSKQRINLSDLSSGKISIKRRSAV